MQTVFEVRTYWRGDLLEVAHTTAGAEGRSQEGPLTVVVRRVRAAMPRPIAQPTDWTFARILCLTAIVELCLFAVFLLTPEDDLTYVLGDRLGTMKSLPGPDWVGRLRSATFSTRPGVAEGQAGARRSGPLLTSPPGSRTYRRPEPDLMIAKILGSISTRGFGDGAVFDSVLTTSDGGALGALVGNEVSGGVAGGFGLSGLGEGGGGRGEGIIGLGSVGVIGRGGGGSGAVGYGSGGGRLGRRRTVVDDKTRVVYCDEIVDYVMDLMPDRDASRPTRSALYRKCRTTSAVKSMTCIGRAKDKRDRRIELLLRCGDGMPSLFRDALAKEGRRE